MIFNRKFTQVVLCSAIFSLTSSCSLIQSMFHDGGNSGPAGAAGAAGGPTAGVQNFLQLRVQMSQATGISYTTDKVVQAQYNSVMPLLSLDGQVTGVNPPMLLAVTALAGSYCSELVASEKSKAAQKQPLTFFTGVNFNASSTSSVTPAMYNQIFSNYASNFYGRAITASEAQILMQAVNDTINASDASGQSAQQLIMNALTVSCTAALSSIDSISS